MSTFKYNRLDKDDVAVLLVDHQSGLTNCVQDFSPDDFKNNVLAFADAAKYFNLPTILTTSFEDGPNGPLVPELKALFPDAPYIARPGNINAWDNEDFVKAVKATGKKQLLIAGIGGLCGVPSTVCERGGIRSLHRHGCLRHLQQNHPRCSLVTHGGGRLPAHELVWSRV
jgi:hypothetical protein